jgi:hypothetical protein
LKRNGWLDFKENFRIKEPARDQANDADRSPDQRVGAAIPELFGR